MSYLLLVLLFVFLEAFFSGSEMAVVSANKALLKRLSERGNKGAEIAVRLLEDMDTTLTVTLIGTNFSTVSAAASFTMFLSSLNVPFVRENVELLTVAFLSPFTVTFGELIPKSLFQRYANSILPVVAFPLYFFYKVFKPVAFILTGFSKLVSFSLGKDNLRTPFVTKEEIGWLIETSPISDFEITEKKILKNVFKMKEKTLGDIYVPLLKVVALRQDSRVKDALKTFETTGFSKLPVYKERFDSLIGYVLVTDLLNEKDKYAPIKKYMRKIPYLPEYMNLLDALKEMRKRKSQMAVVVDEFGSTLGIITVEDILEELVGKIEDEFDKGAQSVQNDGKSLICDAGVEVSEVNWMLKKPLPIGDDYSTLAGLILKKTGKVPEKGQKITVGNYEIEVLDSDERRIKKVRLTQRGGKSEKKSG